MAFFHIKGVRFQPCLISVPETVKFLRLLRLQLQRQLNLIHDGYPAAAAARGEGITQIIEQLTKYPPEGDPLVLERLHGECAELNDLVLDHFRTDRDVTAEHIVKLQVERQIREFLE